MTNLLTLC